ncbi:hypothetical protein JCGZ_19301 [Jatropha curcas]|uniref:Uncharacterized protein n=1 Tax=Jatropha curcas TaxID=180498 RepID=A0A067K013_JATCU|nr:hypothetical protein JCGZ_19301 [Jatropha curcas]
MAPKKAKASKMSKIDEAMKKKSKAERSDKETPLVVLDPPMDNVGTASEFVHVEHAPLSPSTGPSRKRLREVNVLVPPPLPSKSGEALNIQAYFL